MNCQLLYHNLFPNLLKVRKVCRVQNTNVFHKMGEMQYYSVQQYYSPSVKKPRIPLWNQHCFKDSFGKKHWNKNVQNNVAEMLPCTRWLQEVDSYYNQPFTTHISHSHSYILFDLLYSCLAVWTHKMVRSVTLLLLEMEQKYCWAPITMRKSSRNEKKKTKENTLSQDWNPEGQESASLPTPLSHPTVVKATERQVESEKFHYSWISSFRGKVLTKCFTCYHSN